MTDCKLARSLEVKCRLKLDANCDQLRDQLKVVTQQLETSWTRAESAKFAFCQMKEETTDNLPLRVEKCLHGFLMWEVQTLKWLKLDSLERQLMSMKINGTGRHRQLIRLVNSFSSGLEEARENLQIKILGVLRRLGSDGSSEGALIAASDGIAPESSSSRAVEMSRRSK